MLYISLAYAKLLRTGHADGAALKWLGGKFRRNIGQIRLAHPGAGGIARLRHEPIDNPVEDEAVIRWFLSGPRPTRNMPSIPRLCGRTNMRPA